MSMIYARCTKRGVKIYAVIDGKTRSPGLFKRSVERALGHIALLRQSYPGLPLLASSTLDWPRDITKDRKIIAICNAITGNSVK